MKNPISLICLGFASQSLAAHHPKNSQTKIKELSQELTEQLVASASFQKKLSEVLR